MFLKTLFAVMLGVLLCYSATVTNLTVTERANIARTDEDVIMGVPLPENGAYTDASLFTLRDDADNVIPCEIKSVCTWFKNPTYIRWLQLNFPYSIGAGQTKTLHLATETNAYSLSSKLTAQDKGTYIEVNTGKIRFYVRKANFNLIDQAWVDQSGAENYTDANKIIGTHSRGLIHCLNNGEFLSSNDSASTVVIERQGPGQVCLKAVAQLKYGTGATTLTSVTRIYAFNNSQTIKIQTAIEYRESNISKFVNIQGWHVEIPLLLGATRTAVVGKPAGFEQGTLASDQELYCMVKRPDANSSIGTAISGLIGGSATGTFNPKTLKPRDIGWAALSDGSRGCLASMKYFWQMVPASVEALGNGRLVVGIFSKRSQTIPVPFYAGCGRSAEIRLTLFNTATAAELRSRAAGATDRLFAVASPYWYTRRTNSTVRMTEAKADLFPSAITPYVTFMDQRLNSIYATILSADDNWLGYDSYGFLEWGDNPHYDQGGTFPWNILWNGNYYGMDFFALEHYYHTGDLTWLNWGLAHAQHVMDVHQVHMGDTNANTGSSRYCPPANHIATEDGSPSIGNMSHHKTEALFWDYYLTGDDYALQTALEGARYSFGWGFSLAVGPSENVDTYIRRWSHQMASVTWAYQYNHDPKYYAILWQNYEMMKRNIRTLSTTIGYPYQVGLGMESLVRMWEVLAPTYTTNLGVVKADSIPFYLRLWCDRIKANSKGTGSMDINSNVTLGWAFLSKFYGRSYLDTAGRFAEILPATPNNLHKDFAQQARNFEQAMYYFASPDSVVCGEMGVTNTVEEVPQPALELSARPQPFNPVTLITLSGRALKNGAVTLRVYTPSGALVKDLSVEAVSSPSVLWDAGGSPSGVYILKCTAGKETAVKRLTLIK